MKSEILSSTSVRVTGQCPTRAHVAALEPYSKGSLLWEVPPSKVPDGLVPPSLLRLAIREPLSGEGEVNLNERMRNTLFPYQLSSVKQIVHQFRGRCLLADEMGLGKTLQAIACIMHYNVRTLIVCPAFLQTNWLRTLDLWGVEAEVCTYGKVPSLSVWDMVVADEAHYMKNSSSQRTQAVLPHILAAKYALLLSGTPCPNRPEELYPLLHALRPTIITCFQMFANRYCNPRRTVFSAYDTRGSDRPAELKWLLNRAFMIRRNKSDVLTDLPQKMQGVLYVAADESCKEEIRQLQEKLDSALQNGSSLAQNLVMRMYRTTAQAKAKSASELVASRVKPGSIIFAHHQLVLDTIEKELDKSLRVGRIDGTTPLVQRQKVVDGMQDGSLDVAILSMGAAGVGLTLTRANTAYFLEIPWCPAVLRQCEDRIHRIGQQNTCEIYYIIADSTLDRYVWRSIHRKESIAARIGQG